ncbi:MAG: hypothetical protein U0931_22785 [Vulcanimicrobiota bacterium]
MESLVTLMLVGLVFGAVMALLNSGLRIFRDTNQRDEAAQAASVALDRLVCELREATQVSTPGPPPGVSNGQIEFIKADLSNPLRIPGSGLPNASWNGPAFFLMVRYRFDSGRYLLRDVGVQQSGSYSETSQLADQVSGLKCTCRGQGVYAVELSVRYREVVKTHCGTVLCPVLR